MMKLWLTLFVLFTLPAISGAQDIYVCHQVAFSFFSKAPIEDITAKSEKGVSALNVATKSIYFKVAIRSFEFRKSLMQQHFNENYLESDQFPLAEFKGIILENIDPKRDGNFPVTVQGKLSIHGVVKDYTLKGELQMLKGKITAKARFPVKLADHQVKIPRLVIKNIAEVVQVQVSAVYEPLPPSP